MKHVTHWIGGRPYDPAAEPLPDDALGAALTTLRDRAVDLIDPARSGDLFDPATGQRSGSVDLASVRVVDEAVAVAAKAFDSWRRVSLARRANTLFAFRELLNSHADELAELITGEHGKVLADARGEVARGLEVVEFACGIPHLLKGATRRASRPMSTSTRSASRWGSSR